MKKILVPCDFSENAKGAVRMANEIASRSQGEVVVLHSIYFPMIGDPMLSAEMMAYSVQFMDESERTAREEFAAMVKGLGDHAVRHTSLLLPRGGLVENVLETIRTMGIDLVLMSTRGASGLEEVLIGSNTEKIVRLAGVPVLATHRYEALHDIKTIVFPTDLSLRQYELVARVKNLQAFLGAQLKILLVNTPRHFITDAEATGAYHDFIEHYGIANSEFVFRSFRSEEEGILDFIDRSHHSLIFMGTHARRGIAHLLKGSITEDVVNHGAQALVWTSPIRE